MHLNELHEDDFEIALKVSTLSAISLSDLLVIEEAKTAMQLFALIPHNFFGY